MIESGYIWFFGRVVYGLVSSWRPSKARRKNSEEEWVELNCLGQADHLFIYLIFDGLFNVDFHLKVQKREGVNILQHSRSMTLAFVWGLGLSTWLYKHNMITNTGKGEEISEIYRETGKTTWDIWNGWRRETAGPWHPGALSLKLLPSV
jgi:hypothetical protein